MNTKEKPALTVALAVTVCGVLAAPVAFWIGGASVVSAGAVAAVVCLVAGLGAAAVSRRFAQPEQRWQGWLWGSLVRMTIPLAAFAFLLVCWPQSPKAALACCFVGFYVLTLAVDLLVFLPGVTNHV